MAAANIYLVMDAGTPVAAFTARQELKAYLRRPLDTFINPLVYTFVDGREPTNTTRDHPRRQWFIRHSSWLLYYCTANVVKYNGGGNDQVDCCCWFCFSSRDIGASNDTRADTSAG